jgi:competence protein ComGC
MKEMKKLHQDNKGFGVVEVVLIIVVIIALVIIFNNQIKDFLEFALGTLQPTAENLVNTAPEVK